MFFGTPQILIRKGECIEEKRVFSQELKGGLKHHITRDFLGEVFPFRRKRKIKAPCPGGFKKGNVFVKEWPRKFWGKPQNALKNVKPPPKKPKR